MFPHFLHLPCSRLAGLADAGSHFVGFFLLSGLVVGIVRTTGVVEETANHFDVVEHDCEYTGEIVRKQKDVPLFEMAVDEIEDLVEIDVAAYADDVVPAIAKGMVDGLPCGFGEGEVDAGVNRFFHFSGVD